MSMLIRVGPRPFGKLWLLQEPLFGTATYRAFSVSSTCQAKKKQPEAPLFSKILHGEKAAYRVMELRRDNTYLAQLQDADQNWEYGKTGDYVMIKEVLSEREKQIQEAMNECPNIQKMIDVVKEPYREGKNRGVIQYNVLEYMDTRLGKVRPHRGYWKYRPSRRYRFTNPNLVAAVSEAVLKAVAQLQKAGLVHTSIDMYSIQLSHLDQAKPTIKLGSIHNVYPEEEAMNIKQAFENEKRPPEVWAGLGVSYDSCVWVLGATLARWLVSPNPLSSLSDLSDLETEKALAAMDQFADSLALSRDPQALKRNGVLARAGGNRKDARGLRRVLDHMIYLAKSDDCIDFVHSLLVPDPAKRPTAEMALKHRYISPPAEPYPRSSKQS